eukprot:766617-Hanusia_phi.AAC.3
MTIEQHKKQGIQMAKTTGAHWEGQQTKIGTKKMREKRGGWGRRGRGEGPGAYEAGEEHAAGTAGGRRRLLVIS